MSEEQYIVFVSILNSEKDLDDALEALHESNLRKDDDAEVDNHDGE
jgi:glycosyltransferase involved in cell wall biosynthesis